MPGNLLRTVVLARVKHLLEMAAAIGNLEHPGEKGTLGELFLRGVIEAMLPKHFGLGSGIIVDHENRQSPQVDLIVFDTRRMPPALHEHGRGVYPIDSVLRAIEVKSTLNSGG